MEIKQKLISVNFEKGRGGQHPQIIVEHIIGLPGVTAESAYQHFSNPASEVSAHYIIKRTGEIWQCVKDEDTSWGAGSVSYQNGAAIPPTNFIAREHWKKGGRINQIALSIENEGSENEDITETQYKANAELIKELSRKFNIPVDSTHICGHREIKKFKLCPGHLSVGKIISLANAPVAPVAPILNTAKIEVAPFSKPQWLLNLEYRIKIFGGLFGDKTFGAIRSSGWGKLQKETVKAHPFCSFHGGKGTLLNPLQVHHIKPFHLFPLLELIKSNLIVACRFCHLWYCHLGSYHSCNLQAREDAEMLLAKINNRP